jgi:hypothetical protein
LTVNNPLPGIHDIGKLVAFLPLLYADGFIPMEYPESGRRDESGFRIVPMPQYQPVVLEFIDEASLDCWCDYGYDPVATGDMLRDDRLIETADLARIRNMLTFCVRGERFCDGHRAAMIEKGYIRKLLERLTRIAADFEQG